MYQKNGNSIELPFFFPGRVPGACLFPLDIKLRRELADRESVAACTVFSDAALRDMAAKLPRNESRLPAVSGVGKYKLKKYGKAFLEKLSEVV